MTQQTKTLALTVAANICRLLLAATFIFSGLIKANDPLGTVYKLQDYLLAIAWFQLPDTFLLGCAVILAFFEFTLGVYSLFGIYRKETSRITVVFMILMTLLTVYIAIANPVSDCGCFGDVIILSNAATLIKNIVLLAAAMFVCRYYRLQKDFLTPNLQWLVMFLSLCTIIGYAIYCIICLPLFDFRPYKVGTNLQEVVMNNNKPRFDIAIIYEKDGQTLTLTAEDEDPDSTWTYVETRRIPHTGTDLAASDFYVTNMEEEDITPEILLNEGYTFLLIIPNLRNADEGCIDKVNAIYEYTQDNQLGFYCLTASSGARDQRYWRDHTGAEYSFSLAEERMLKTVVRGQPGLVLLHNGVILKKWSNYNLPKEEDLKQFLQ